MSLRAMRRLQTSGLLTVAAAITLLAAATALLDRRISPQQTPTV